MRENERENERESKRARERERERESALERRGRESSRERQRTSELARERRDLLKKKLIAGECVEALGIKRQGYPLKSQYKGAIVNCASPLQSLHSERDIDRHRHTQTHTQTNTHTHTHTHTHTCKYIHTRMKMLSSAHGKSHYDCRKSSSSRNSTSVQGSVVNFASPLTCAHACARARTHTHTHLYTFGFSKLM